MDESASTSVIPGGESAGQFDAACQQVRLMTEAQCAVVIVIGGVAGSGYSVTGSLESQMLLPDVLEKIAHTLRGQLAKKLQ
ncbi:hypothetical protein [Paraburkholderia sp. BCC1884]|uniref:hypothetical protein n=1 Tax=Paraburkholderia sp. BCC1884 TaxID=2562668 RepID=UPI00118432EC|nr:hypothetical protein [Paraburkholderia sp. BCC1884]